MFCGRVLKLFLFERKSYKKKQKPFRFIDGADSFGIPFDVLFRCLSHGRRTQKLPRSKSVAVSLCAEIIFGTDFGTAMNVLPSMKNPQFFPISGCSAVAFAVTQKHLSGSRSGFAEVSHIGQTEHLRFFSSFSVRTEKNEKNRKRSV